MPPHIRENRHASGPSLTCTLTRMRPRNQLKPEHADEYKKLHAAAWPGVLAALARHHIADYSIHYYPPLDLLVAHMKYVGADYAADVAGIAADPETNRWWALTDGMQESFNAGATGSKGSPEPWWTVSGVRGCCPRGELMGCI
jgi:L-rhamnose mutarotase